MTTLRVTVVSTFYPNTSDPYRAVFVRNLTVAMARRGVSIEVVSPVPYAPPWPARPDWRALRAIAPRELRDGMEVSHPRFAVIPRFASLAGFTYAFGVAGTLRKLRDRGAADVVHVHCAYPDGVAVARLARRYRLPFVITAHGSDINVYANRRGIHPQVRAAVEQADAVVAVSAALRSRIQQLAPASSARVVRIPCCGFDPATFFPASREEARRAVGLQPVRKLVVFVGQLVPIKALDDLMDAWRRGLGNGAFNQDDRLLLIGDGPLRTRLQAVAARDSMGTVVLTGSMPQERIAGYLRAANLLCLPSLNEGLPNVVVEALASGIPVVATDVGGLKELIVPERNGLLVPPSRPDLLADALGRAAVTEWDTHQIVDAVRDYTWDSLAGRNIEVLSAVARRTVLPADAVQ
jgi:glycosyltransferase involved in cell wall biosynthesis